METKPLYKIRHRKVNGIKLRGNYTVCVINSFENYIYLPSYAVEGGNGRSPRRFMLAAAFYAQKESLLRTRKVFKALKEHFDKEDFLVLEYYEGPLQAYISSGNYNIEQKIRKEIAENLNIENGAGLLILFSNKGIQTVTKLTKCFGVLHDKL